MLNRIKKKKNGIINCLLNSTDKIAIVTFREEFNAKFKVNHYYNQKSITK